MQTCTELLDVPSTSSQVQVESDDDLDDDLDDTVIVADIQEEKYIDCGVQTQVKAPIWSVLHPTGRHGWGGGCLNQLMFKQEGDAQMSHKKLW